MGREGMRAGDTDRKAVADQLKVALDEGRLDLGEYDERLQKAYAAKTYGELDGLLGDLPGTVPVRAAQLQPAEAPDRPAVITRPTARQVAGWVGPYGGVVLVCVLIWLISSVSAGHLTYFWPVWMLIPLVLGLSGQWFGHGDRRYRRRDRHRR